MASSSALVCSDWVPPSVAASASIVVRTNVVVRVLLGEAHARGLAVGAQRHRHRVLRLEPRHQLGPQQPRRAELGHLHEEVHADAEEEGEPGREGVDVEATRECGADIVEAVREREGQLLRAGRAGLLHVVAADRDRVEARHVPGRVRDDVGDDTHGRLGRVDIGVADHELLEDVVLDRAGEVRLCDALLLGGDDVARQHRQHGAVHGHRHAHLVERDAVEEQLHVLDGIDSHTRLSDIAGHARMVAVIAAVGGEVEGDGQALLPGGEIGAVEGVGLLRRREAGILPDRPGPVGVHGGARPAQEGRESGQRAQMLHLLEVGGRVERLDGYAFRRRAHQILRPGAPGGPSAPAPPSLPATASGNRSWQPLPSSGGETYLIAPRRRGGNRRVRIQSAPSTAMNSPVPACALSALISVYSGEL